jgi:galactokinase
LKLLYQVSCDELDFIVSFLKHSDHVSGARMMGGGFGGCVIALIKTNSVDEICQKCQVLYAQTFGKHSDYFTVHATNGCQVIT